MSENQQDDSTILSADRTSDGGFFIDDYSHLRLSYYQYRDAMALDVSDSAFNDSAYSTNASSNQSFDTNATGSTTLTNSTSATNSTYATNSTIRTNSVDWNAEERRKLREYYVSQIPDLPHPSYTVASVIASASHRMNPKNRFVYNNRIEQGTPLEDDMVKFSPSRRSTLKPGDKL